MIKSKKRIIFIISMVVTMLICFEFFKILSNCMKPKQEYSINSGIRVRSNNKVLDKAQYDVNEFLGNNDQVNLDIFNYNSRNVKYELIILVNYSQSEFNVNKQKVKSYCFDVEMNENRMITLSLDSNIFMYKVNDITIVLRQDIDIHSVDNELVSDSNTMSRHYLVTNKLSEKNMAGTFKKNVILDNTDTEANLKCLNKSVSYEIKTGINDKLKFRLKMSNNEMNYIVVCLQEGRQIKINKKLYEYIYENKLDIELYPYGKKGKYELEMICIPDLIHANDVNEQEVSIVNTNRFTLEVE